VVEIGRVDGLITPLDVCFTPNTGRKWVHEFESVVDPKRKLVEAADRHALSLSIE
jgi:hypothetical protein